MKISVPFEHCRDKFCITGKHDSATRLGIIDTEAIITEAAQFSKHARVTNDGSLLVS